MTEHRGRGRPTVSSREAIEQYAIELFLRDGYTATSIPMIAAASGVSRTSVFRYWGSKSDIVWAPFDTHLERLAALLADADPETPTMEVVRTTAVENLRLSMLDSALWLERFVVIDTAAELRAEEAEHWSRWADIVSEFVSRRRGLGAPDVTAAGAAGAVQATFVAVLRRWRARQDSSASVLDDLDAALAPLCDAMQALLDRSDAADEVTRA